MIRERIVVPIRTRRSAIHRQREVRGLLFSASLFGLVFVSKGRSCTIGPSGVLGGVSDKLQELPEHFSLQLQPNDIYYHTRK